MKIEEYKGDMLQADGTDIDSRAEARSEHHRSFLVGMYRRENAAP